MCELCGGDMCQTRTPLPEYLLDDFFYRLTQEERDKFEEDHTEEYWYCTRCGHEDRP